MAEATEGVLTLAQLFGILKDACLFSLGLEHFRSNLAFDFHNILFLECSIENILIEIDSYL